MKKFTIEDLLQGKQPESVEELQELLNQAMVSMNKKAEDDFCGLSPNQMQYLLYNPFAEDSPFKWKNFDPKILDNCPFFRITEEALRLTVCTASPFTLTTSTASLPVKIVKELYGLGLFPDKYIEKGITKLNKETDWYILHVCKIVLELSGVVRKVKGKWNLTKKGQGLIQPSNRVQLFKLIFETYTTRYNWAYMDGIGHPSSGQMAFAFSLSMLSAFGHEQQSIAFYGEKYLKAFPMLEREMPSNEYFTRKDHVISSLYARFFSRFTDWFGLSQFIDAQTLSSKDYTLQKKPLLDSLFSFPKLS